MYNKNVNKKAKYLFIISLLWLFFFVFFLCRPEISNNYTCTGSVVEAMGDISQFFLIYPLILLIFSSIFYFLDDQTFNLWFKFAKYYLPIAFLFILVSVISPGSGSWASSGFDSELATWFTAGLFVTISIFIIVIKSWRLRRQTR